MFGRLHIAERGHPDRIVELTGTATIGRTTDNDIVLDTDGVSHCHAMLLAQPSGVTLVDLGSTFGTFVNSVQASPDEPVQLLDGARIGIGHVALHYLAPRTTAVLPPTFNGQFSARPNLAIPHLNTRLDGLTLDAPIKVGKYVTLRIWVGAPLAVDECQSSRPLELISQGVTGPVELRVRVRTASPAWQAIPEEPMLLAESWGSAQVARYRLVARKPERTLIGVAVDLAATRSLLQYFKLGVNAIGANGARATALPQRSSAIAGADPSRARCRQCGAAIRAGARFCVQCGAGV
jgi:hypothetical protein